MMKWFKGMLLKLREPKWRHGRLSVLLMSGFLAVLTLLNVGVGALEDEYGWRTDMSFNSYATTGESTRAALEALDRDVELYLLYQNGSEDMQILQVLNRYRTQSQRVSVLPTDIAKNPGILTRFPGDSETALEADTVVVNCPETGRYKLLNYSDFFTSGYSIEAGAFQVEGLAYEKALTEAIVYVSRDEVRVVGFLQGHGELAFESMETLTGLLEVNGYDSVAVNLLAGETLEAVDLLLIAGAQGDLTDAETAAVSAFAQNGGSLLVIRDYTDPLLNMSNYLALLRNYGVIPLPGIVVASDQDAGSYYGEPLYLLPDMCEVDFTLSLLASGRNRLLMPAACAFETPAQGDQSLTVETVLKTGKHAYLRSLTDGSDTVEKQEGDREGELSLALYARRMHPNGNISRLFAIGNSAMFINEFIYQRTFGGEAFMMALMRELAPQAETAMDIAPTSVFRPALTAGSQTMGVALLVALPLLVVAVALCVLLPRRNR